MNEPFSQFRAKGLMVSELAQQLWCEKRVEMELLHGKEETEEMRAGGERHRELFEEITPILLVQPETWIDEIFVRCYQMWLLCHKVKNEGMARELPVYGKVGTMLIRGVIDELIIKGREAYIIETKTRVSGEVPDYRAYERVVEFQVSLYKSMLDSIRRGSFTCNDFIEFYRIGPELCISETLSKIFPRKALFTTNVGLMAFIAFETLRTLPETSDTMIVRYENHKREIIGEREIIYDEENFEKTMDFVLGYWKGEREAVPVSKNLWKCEYCPEKLRNRCDAHRSE